MPRSTRKTDRTEAVHDRITQRILDDLAAGTAPWHKSWNVPALCRLPLRHGGQPYQGVNILILWAAALDAGYVSPHWMTYRQARELGGQVRRGERASHVFFAKTYEVDDPDADVPPGDGPARRPVHVRRAYAVFNSEQIDGLPDEYHPDVPATNTDERLAAAERWFASLGSTIRHGGAYAYYDRSRDAIRMPLFASFDDAPAYYATLAHEHVHWTHPENRANRPLGERGTEDYAREELVAELGAAFLCADLGIAAEPRPDHASYIAGWLKALTDDAHAIADAATLAQRAVRYLHSIAAPVAAAA